MTGSLLVIAPHPDDEILGAGGIIARCCEQGGMVAILYATDGSRSDPAIDPANLAKLRQQECMTGLKTLLGVLPDVLFLDQPDGGFDSTSIDLCAEPLASFLRNAAPDTIIVTDPADAHLDHKAAFGLATRIISAGFARELFVIPVSQRVDGVFDDSKFDRLPVAHFSERKAAAIACHASQIKANAGFSLAPTVLAAFDKTEYVRLAYNRDDTGDDAVPAAHFDAMFGASQDPWRYDDEPYERDRFRRTCAALGGQSYASALELGCANGALTEQLAPLCQALLATDASSAALAAARKRVGAIGNVTLQTAVLPHEVPEGPFDLIVASDMLYYLGLEGVIAAIARLKQQATERCRILIASYLGETDTRLTGEMASETAIAHLGGWRRIHAERTDKLRIDVLEQGCV